MGSTSREDVVEIFDALDTVVDRWCELSSDVLTAPDRLRAPERLERVAHRLRTPRHAVLSAQAGEGELGGRLRSAPADRLRITKAEAGESLAPRPTATAAAQRDGLVGDGHVMVIRSFFARTDRPRSTCAPGNPPKPAWPVSPARTVPPDDDEPD